MDSISFEQFEVLCDSFESKYEVPTKIHPHDYLFHYILNSKKDISGAIVDYHDSGERVVLQLRELLFEILHLPEDIRYSFLDFASGYGRLTRYFKKCIPALDVFASDIHQDANLFNQKYFSCQTIPSTFVPENFQADVKFDIIFVFSLFTHLPRATWERWLTSLYMNLAPSGVMVFTSHGKEVLSRWGASTDPDGFLWRPITEQIDLSVSDYGGSVSLPTYVVPKILSLENSQIVFMAETWFDNLHDVYAVKKLK